MLATGIGWYVGQVEPDCMTALVMLGAYLLLFRSALSGPGAARSLVAAITGLAVACHPSHLGLMAGLLLVACAREVGLARAAACKSCQRLQAFLLALRLIFASNYVLTRQLFLTRSGRSSSSRG